MMPSRPASSVPFSDAALRTTLERLEGEWDDFQTARDRDAVYGFLTAVFEVGTWWILERKAAECARRALSLGGHTTAADPPEPFAALILCTADPKKVDYRTRSKFSRVLRYAFEFKRWDESLTAFIKRKGGINKCAARFTQRLGRGRPHQALGRIAK
jgi:hypothetical protein